MKYKGKEIIVACPSYKRYKVETLAYIPFCKVYVAPEEYEAYLEFNPKHTENIVKCPKGVQGNLCKFVIISLTQNLKMVQILCY